MAIRKSLSAICTVFVLFPKCISAQAQTSVFFDPGQYTVMENVGTFKLTVTRQSDDLSQALCVDFKSTDGTAIKGSDYEFTEGTIIFKPGEIYKQLSLVVIDDNSFEEDEYLYVELSNLTHLSLASLLWHIGKQNSPRWDAAERGIPSEAILFAKRKFIENWEKN